MSTMITMVPTIGFFKAVAIGDSFAAGCYICFMLMQVDDHFGGAMFLFGPFGRVDFPMSPLVSWL
jgi:hypothetical protein